MIKKKELRKSLIEDKLKEIVDSLEFIEKELPPEFELFDTRTLRNSIYKEIEFVIQNIIDILSIINSDLRLGTPETEDSILDNIEKNKILSKKSIEIIKEMKSFRNVLVHKYGKIDNEIAFDNIKQGLSDFESITNEIDNFLKKY